MGAVEIRALPLVASILLVLYSFLLTEKKKKKGTLVGGKMEQGVGRQRKKEKEICGCVVAGGHCWQWLSKGNRFLVWL